MDDENKTLAHVQEKTQEANHLAANDSKTQMGNDSPSVYTEHVNSEEGALKNKVNDVADYLEAIHLAGSVSDKRGKPLLWILLRMFMFCSTTLIFLQKHFFFKKSADFKSKTVIYGSAVWVKLLMFVQQHICGQQPWSPTHTQTNFDQE